MYRRMFSKKNGTNSIKILCTGARKIFDTIWAMLRNVFGTVLHVSIVLNFKAHCDACTV